jgi:hypothetical protein
VADLRLNFTRQHPNVAADTASPQRLRGGEMCLEAEAYAVAIEHHGIAPASPRGKQKSTRWQSSTRLCPLFVLELRTTLASSQWLLSHTGLALQRYLALPLVLRRLVHVRMHGLNGRSDRPPQ